MKQSGIIKNIEPKDGGFLISLKDVSGFYYISKLPELLGIEVGSKVDILYEMTEEFGFKIARITKFRAPEFSQTVKDINASVVLKILGSMICSGKISNDKNTLIEEGKKWLSIQEELRQ